MTTEQRLSRLESQFESIERVLQDLDAQVKTVNRKLELLNAVNQRVQVIDSYYHVRETFWDKVIFWLPLYFTNLGFFIALIIVLIFLL